MVLPLVPQKREKEFTKMSTSINLGNPQATLEFFDPERPQKGKNYGKIQNVRKGF